MASSGATSFSRETRLLAATIGISIVVLVVLSRFRFPNVAADVRDAASAQPLARLAARAAFDALPLLQRAQHVQVLTIEEEERQEGAPADAEIAAALKRHGINVTATTISAAGTSAGEEIHRRAAENSGLLVMGAYGHSRFRQFAFGGVTRHI